MASRDGLYWCLGSCSSAADLCEGMRSAAKAAFEDPSIIVIRYEDVVIIKLQFCF